MKRHTLLPCLLVPLLCSCAATSLKGTWKSPEFRGGPATKVAVIAVDQRTMLRQGFENRLAAQISRTGATGITTYDLMALPDIKQDKQAAAARFQAAGADSVAVLRLMDVDTYYREVRPGPSRYAGYVSGIESYTWYDYYSVSFADFSPTYGSLKQKVYLETSLFDLKTGKRVWSGLTQTVIKENSDRVAEADPLVATIVKAMQTDRVLP